LPETLLQFSSRVATADGTVYRVRACGAPMPEGTWQGWLEFDPVDGGPTIRSQRETTQPNRGDAEYWASGLTPIYLEGALKRAIEGPVRVPTVTVRQPVFDTPAPAVATVPADEPAVHSVLDPFSVYEKGEALLRRQLAALSAWHLVNIIIDYELSDEPVATLNVTPAPVLIDTIVRRVREERLLRR
jgi:hypothetical protein